MKCASHIWVPHYPVATLVYWLDKDTQIRLGISPNLGELNFLYLFWSHVVNRLREAFTPEKNYFNDAGGTLMGLLNNYFSGVNAFHICSTMCVWNKNKKFNSPQFPETGYSYLGTLLSSHYSYLGIQVPGHYSYLGTQAPGYNSYLSNLGNLVPSHCSYVSTPVPGHYSYLGTLVPSHHTYLGNPVPGHYSYLGTRLSNQVLLIAWYQVWPGCS